MKTHSVKVALRPPLPTVETVRTRGGEEEEVDSVGEEDFFPLLPSLFSCIAFILCLSCMELFCVAAGSLESLFWTRGRAEL